MGELRHAATGMRCKGWRPYSKFPVGAAVLTVDGKVFGGPGNVECANYSLTKHAEETAILAAITNGALEVDVGGGERRKRRRFLRAIYLAAVAGKEINPCGGCRQFMWEFAEEGAVVIREQASGGVDVFRLAELLKEPFGPDDLSVSEDESPA